MTTSASEAYELHCQAANEAEERAAEYAAKGFDSMVAIARRKAAGHRAACTRIARREGWR